MNWRAIALAMITVCAVGCHAQLENQASNVDASGSNGSDQDASGSAAADAAVSIDAAPACATGRVLYLNFDGATLTKATTSDATQNHASWMGVTQPITTATMPGYLANNANRAQLIVDVTNAVKAGLAAYPSISIVTTRPAAGPYVMIGFGGTEAMVAIQYRFAVQKLDCGDTNKNDLGWVFDDAGGTQKAANDAIGAVGFGMGLTGTTTTTDCMCGWLSNCVQASSACTLSASIPALANCNMNPQNEIAAFQSFCN
ncbi:MAG: hypothetical protein JWO36_4305 [Myxococcales bacterium]|nr:hypothetical protein [Myxococcales bacterium]